MAIADAPIASVAIAGSPGPGSTAARLTFAGIAFNAVVETAPLGLATLAFSGISFSARVDDVTTHARLTFGGVSFTALGANLSRIVTCLTLVGVPTTAMQASFATNVMTVVSLTGSLLNAPDGITVGATAVGTVITAAGVTDGTWITAQLTGSAGGTGTYSLSTSPGIIVQEAVTTLYGWLVPATWTSNSNTVEALGSAGNGGPGSVALSRGGGGGGGGAYSKKSNITLTAGNYVPYQVGTHNIGNASPVSGGSWFNGFDTDTGGTHKVSARGGLEGDSGTIGVGGAAGSTAGIGTIKFAGGAGGDGNTAGAIFGGGGGGGAGGPNGDGVIGGGGTSTDGGAGGNGDASSGGAGGTGATSSADAIAGSDGSEFADHHCGAGGGGGGGSPSTHKNGAIGGSSGAGGGGSSISSGLGTPGAGTNGRIVVQWSLTSTNAVMAFAGLSFNAAALDISRNDAAMHFSGISFHGVVFTGETSTAAMHFGGITIAATALGISPTAGAKRSFWTFGA